MKKVITALSISLFSTLAFSKDLPTVAITQIIEHPSLDAVRSGIIETLKKNKFNNKANINILYDNAQGNITTSMQIAKKFASINPKVIIAISTPSSQSAVAATKNLDIPIVFAAVSDPLYAKLVKDIHNQKRNITGATDVQPLDNQLDLIKQIIPKIAKLGVIYNSGEVNSVKIVSDLKINDKEIEIIESVANKSSDVAAAASKLIGKVDAIFLPLDNTVVSALNSVLKVTNKAKVPTFSSDPDLVKKGVLASIGISYTDIGNLAGEMASEILKGKKASEIKIQAPENSKTYINLGTAKMIGIEIDSKIRNQSDYIFE